MTITNRQLGEVIILDLKGKITIGVGDVQLRSALHEALDAGQRHILLNMAGVTAMDSSGIGELVSTYTTTTSRGGRLKLLDLPPKIGDMLQITQLITIFEIYEDETEALESF